MGAAPSFAGPRQAIIRKSEPITFEFIPYSKRLVRDRVETRLKTPRQTGAVVNSARKPTVPRR